MSVGKKLAIAASFAVPAMLGICIYVARTLKVFDFCDLFTAISLVRATRTSRVEENEDESSGESTKDGSNDSNVDKSDRKSIQGTDSASGQK